MLEKDIEKILTEQVKSQGGRAYKWVSPGNDGVPDRIVIFPDQRPIFVELKTIKGTESALQKVQIKRLENLGQRVIVTHGVTGLVYFFRFYGYSEVADQLQKRYKKQLAEESKK